jgi:serine O-acetyltransferase
MAHAMVTGEGGLWALLVYRLGRWSLARKKAPGAKRSERHLAACAWPFFRAAEVAVSLLFDIRLDVRADIAPGLYIGHFKSIYVGPGVRIGAECNIGQMCFVSAAGPGFPPGTPVVGNRVYLGVGCKVMGPVIVGNDVAIGANAVVLANVPDRAVVVGNPAKVISHDGSGDFIGAFQHDAPALPTTQAEPLASPPSA